MKEENKLFDYYKAKYECYRVSATDDNGKIAFEKYKSFLEDSLTDSFVNEFANRTLDQLKSEWLRPTSFEVFVLYEYKRRRNLLTEKSAYFPVKRKIKVKK